MNKKNLIIIGIVLLLLVAGGVFFVASRNANLKEDELPITEEQTVGKLSPQDIGLELKMLKNNQQVKVVVSNAKEIKSLDYDITYDADIPASELGRGEEGGKVERGFSDEAVISSGQTKYESKAFDLGSCSRNVCRYDTGVEEVRLFMKVVKKDGKVYEVETSVSF